MANSCAERELSAFLSADALLSSSASTADGLPERGPGSLEGAPQAPKYALSEANDGGEDADEGKGGANKEDAKEDPEGHPCQ